MELAEVISLTRSKSPEPEDCLPMSRFLFAFLLESGQITVRESDGVIDEHEMHEEHTAIVVEVDFTRNHA